MMKFKDKVMIAIKRREDLEPVKISLRKLLANNDMEHYLNLCADRLAEELKIDGEDTAFNFADFPDVLFTQDGFFDCRRVLENYLPFDTLADTWQLMIETDRENREASSMAASFRKLKLRDLLKYYMKWRTEKTNTDAEQEAKQLVCHWITAELWSRSFFSGIYRKTREALTQLYVSWKYRGLFNIMREAAAKYSE